MYILKGYIYISVYNFLDPIKGLEGGNSQTQSQPSDLAYPQEMATQEQELHQPKAQLAFPGCEGASPWMFADRCPLFRIPRMLAMQIPKFGQIQMGYCNGCLHIVGIHGFSSLANQLKATLKGWATPQGLWTFRLQTHPIPDWQQLQTGTRQAINCQKDLHSLRVQLPVILHCKPTDTVLRTRTTGIKAPNYVRI